MHHMPHNSGWIEVICGSMFSGKTEELISRLRREQIAKKNVLVFKPAIDDRYASDAVVSHSEYSLPCIVVDKAEQILDLAQKHNPHVIGIDEVQFLGETVVDVVDQLAHNGYRVICAGLDQDYTGNPFEPMPRLLALAEFVTKKLAVCMSCGNPANRTQRLTKDEGQVLVGAKEYEARCRKCHEV